jgi:hypothetical protein
VRGISFKIDFLFYKNNTSLEEMMKTKVFYRVIVYASIVVSVLMFFGLAHAGVTARVDGFVGVPFGSSKPQVATAMNRLGYKYEAEAKGFLDGTSYVVYRGTFIGWKADLTFAFGKHGLYEGEADILLLRDQDKVFWSSAYPGFKEKLAWKYGPPDQNDAETDAFGRKGVICRWKNLQTEGSPPARVGIMLWGGHGRRLQTMGLASTPALFRNGLLIVYSAELGDNLY